jgi:hypothetical protein
MMAIFHLSRKRAKSSGIQLTAADAAIVKGMLMRGDRQHDIASWFGVNAGRVAEVATESEFRFITAAPVSELPPPGPYLSGRAAHIAMLALSDAKAALAKAEYFIRAET